MRAYCIYLRTIDNIAACMQSRTTDAGHFSSSVSADLTQMSMVFFFFAERCLAFYEGKFLDSLRTSDSLEISSQAIAEIIQVGLCHTWPPVTA